MECAPMRSSEQFLQGNVLYQKSIGWSLFAAGLLLDINNCSGPFSVGATRFVSRVFALLLRQVEQTVSLPASFGQCRRWAAALWMLVQCASRERLDLSRQQSVCGAVEHLHS